MKLTLSLLTLFITFTLFSQNKDFSQHLFADYDTYKEKTIAKRRIKHHEIQPLIESLKSENGFEVNVLGKSIEGRTISMISIGTGETNILLWSQMHGDEPTATMAIFDMFNYLKTNKEILQNVKLHFIPMLNPDGAEKFNRRNAIGIDINRDALRLQSPESKILKAARDSLHADFGFNLHDQSKYYNTVRTDKPATISFLAPAYNYEKSINNIRGNAMKIIIEMNAVIQEYAKGQVGRYSDDFEPRAFGDNIQKWGTSTILVESGGYNNDAEKQFIRKLNYVALLTAVQSISKGTYKKNNIAKYEDIPKNDRKLFDLKITNITFPYLGNKFTVDLGINNIERDNKEHSDFYYIGSIVDIGDLSTYYGYNKHDAKDLTFKNGKTYPKIISNSGDLENMDFEELIRKGYTSIGIDSIPKNIKYTNYPINIINVKNIAISKNNTPKSPLQLGKNPTFLLTRNKKVIYAVINGFIYDMNNGENHIKNGLVE